MKINYLYKKPNDQIMRILIVAIECADNGIHHIRALMYSNVDFKITVI